ncbi:uncharacterized protein si:ch73-43g23.1 [Phyllopteryx taeniolatus]|uniref:uncharacterized protein si:ch73-43g23.1 n=1 Tax=Phyllopteryx taeniolatus TaxID=161469 RepID=UPI002AD28347|nr:uncharacterized protein si:ch73-43g23.1 [Phyllopteryx taeniolatus]
MDSWTLQGDSYSLLHSAPCRPFTLCHRDGTPNHVEIFDITSSPSQRSAISETTCLCDIFGDDCESPSASSNAAVGSFVHSQTEVERTTVVSPLVDDLNDSSGSYHTAPGSTEGEEGFEDLTERIYSPALQGESTECEQLEQTIVSSELSKDSSSNFELKSKSPIPQLNAAGPLSEFDNTDFRERTPSPGHNSSSSLCSQETFLCYSSAETSCSPPLLHPGCEQGRLTPVLKSTINNSLPHQFLTQSPSCEPMNCSTSSSSESVNTQSQLKETEPQPRSTHLNKNISASPGPTHTDYASQSSNVESVAALSSHLPSSGYTESQSGKALLSSELNYSSSLADTQASSPLNKLRGRVFLPDLLSRGSTPDVEIEKSPHSCESTKDLSTTEINFKSSQFGTNIPTASPRYTPPSPVISVSPSPVDSGVVPELKHTSPSPDLLSAPSALHKSGSRTSSPGLSSHSSAFSEVITEACSSVINYSLSPSPGIKSTCSSIESTCTAPSPEIRITASSPEIKRRDYISEEQTIPDSPLFESAPSRSLTSSPHITGISYPAVRSEEGITPPLPELCRLPTPGSDITRTSPMRRSTSPSKAGTPQYSSPVSGFSGSELHTEITHSRSRTSSPQSMRCTPSPELRYQSLNSSSELRSRDPSPATPSLANKYNQHSLSTLCSKYNAHYLQPTPPLETSEGVTSSLPNQHIELETQGVQRAFELDKEDKASETKSSSPVVLIQSPVSNLPFLTEEKVDHALIQQHPQDKLTQNKVPVAGLASFSAENLDTGPINHFNSPTIKCKSFPPNCLFTNKGRAHRISNKAKSLQREEKRLNQHTYNSFKSNFTSDHSRQKLGERARFAQNMAHHVNRRKTPSPPLTRFTPVHIIAPEKPRRQWQNRCHSDFVASSQGGYLKKTVSNRESPDIVPPDNNSQLHSVQLGKQLEVERKMQLEKKRERERGIEREYHREGREIEKGEEWQKDVSYREQVELSFNPKNRKGPASHSTAPTNTESCQGLSTVHSYPESLLTTRQPQEQESRLKLASQRDKSGGPPRRFQNPALQNKFSPRSVTNRPGRSSSSSMGSELDEADNEVKWLTDVAFRSLSSPEVDYLDMYNSSHRSSTNISQPSTQESPAGIIGAWATYADFRGSASKLDSDDLSFQQQSLYHSDGIDPARCYEMGSFECIDVAVEREDTRNFRRGVPKRQIQLKRKERVDDGSENTSPGLPAMENSPSLERHSKEALLRQYSTPAAGQEGYGGHDGGHHDRKAKLQKSISLDETSSKTKMATCLIKSVLSKKMQSADKQLHDPDGDEVNTTFGQNNIYEENHECDKLNSSLCSNYSNPCEDFAMKEEQSQRDDIRPPKSYGEKSNRPSSNSRIKISNLSHTDNQQWGSQDCNTSATSEIRSKLRVPSDSSQSIGGIQHVDDSKTWQGRESGDSANTIAGNKGAPSALGAFSTQTRMTSQHQECENTEVHKQLQQGDKSRHMTQENRLQGGKKKKASLNVCLTPEAENNRDKSSPDMHFKQQEEKVKETNVDLQTEEENRSEDNKLKGPIHKVRDVRRLVKNTYNLSFKAPSCVSPSDITEERIGHLDETNKNEIKENVKENLKGRTVELCEERTNKCMGERKEAKKVEGKDEKLSTLPSTLQTEGKPLSQLQPMQIQCKAVCLKDDKNKIQSHKDIGNHGGKTLGSTNTEQDKNPSKTDTEGGMQEPSARGTTTKSQQRNFNMDAESLKTDSEERSVLVGTDTKDPMLGSLPKLPSKEREVSTAVVLIRDGSSQAKTCAPLTQEEVPTLLQAASSPEITTTGSTPSSSSHSVSMLLKEKGYRADIGAVVGDSQNRTGGKGVPHKHVNCLEIPLQMPSDDGAEPNREETFSASSTVPSPSLVSDYVDKPPKSRDKEGGCIKEKTISPQGNPPDQLSTLNKHKEHTDFEVMKRQDPTFHPRSPAIRRFKPQPIEVKSLSKETPKQEMITKSPINRPQTIEVKSIAKNSEKPAVPPKPTCKFKPADLGAKTNEVPASAMPNVKPQIEERPQTIVVSSPTIYRKIPSESSSMSNQTRKLAVSAVSSLKPPPSKITKTTVSSVTNQTASSSGTEASKTQQQHPWTAHVRLAHATTATSIPLPSIPSIEGPNSDPVPKHVPEPSSTEPRHTSQPVVVEQNLHEAAVTTSSNNPKPPAAVSTTQALGYTHQQYCRSLSSEHTQRAGDPHFYASDDPPSYDERESFSPLMPDLTHRRSNRYQNRSYPPSCSCTAGCPPQPALPPPAPHHHHSPHNLTPPAPPHSPGHVLPYQASQPLVRPHQCRADPQPMSFQPSSSPKPSPHGPSHPPTMYQPLHLPPPCPPHPSLMPVDRTMPSDSRRLPPHRSPQQHQPPSMPGAPYSDPIHSHSPGLAPMEHQYMCGQYGSEYGGDTSSLYSESSYGPTPRRVLLDPETGKYFYIELPMQPLRKMLFDPETGQYVEVLIPQQGVSHSGLYPPSAAPYTSLHNTNMYGSAPQYMPFSAPPPTAHPQAQHQPPRYPEALSAATMHPNGLSGNYRSCSGQGSKPDATSHLPLDQNYLEGMYYVPTGINAGSNTTLPVYYHKHPPSLPPSGGKKS